MCTNKEIYYNLLITLMNVCQSCVLTPPKSPFFVKIFCMFDKNLVGNLIFRMTSFTILLCCFVVGRLFVVIDVNPSYGFWTTRLMKVFGHEGKCTCIYNTHGWIVYIMLFLVVCGISRGSSWLRRNEFLKMTK
jgi:hypothetical protein